MPGTQGGAFVLGVNLIILFWPLCRFGRGGIFLSLEKLDEREIIFETWKTQSREGGESWKNSMALENTADMTFILEYYVDLDPLLRFHTSSHSQCQQYEATCYYDTTK